MSKAPALATLTGTTPGVVPPSAPIEGTPAAQTPPIAKAAPEPGAQVQTTDAAKQDEASKLAQDATPGEGKDTTPAKTEDETPTRFASIAKKEAKLVKDRETYKQEFDTYKKERELWESEYKPKVEDFVGRFAKFEELKKTNVVEAIRVLGLDDTEVFNLMAAQSEKKELTPQEIVAAEMKKRDDAAAEERKKQQLEHDERVINGFKSNISKVVQDNKEKFEYCSHYGAVAESVIFNLVNETFTATKEVLTPQEAAEIVEEYYENEFKLLSTSIKKLKPKVTETPKEEATQNKQEASPAPGSKTITPKLTPTIPTGVPKTETRAEKKERLANILRNGGKA